MATVQSSIVTTKRPVIKPLTTFKGYSTILVMSLYVWITDDILVFKTKEKYYFINNEGYWV